MQIPASECRATRIHNIITDASQILDRKQVSRVRAECERAVLIDRG
jgi:hypothetical protein